MTKNPLSSRAGFTYIAALVMVVLLGIMSTQLTEVWTLKMKREREADLLYRGTQVRDAMRRYYSMKIVDGKIVQGTPARPSIAELKVLLSGSDTGKVHYLRPSNMTVQDPASGKVLEWELYKNPTTQRVTGVYIKSEGVPLKQDNFPLDLHPDDFKGKKKYSDWLFLVDRVPPPTPPAGTQNLPGATGVPGSGSPDSGNPNPGGAGTGLGGSGAASPSGK